MKSRLLGILPWRKNASEQAGTKPLNEVEAWFQLAMEQSATLEMILPDHESGQKAVVRGTPYQVRQGRVFVEIHEHGLHLPAIKGCQAFCFMGVRREGRMEFCRFTTSVLDSGITNLGFRMALITLPRRMEALARAALRIEPESGQIPRAELWAAKLLKPGQERNSNQWGAPDLLHLADGTDQPAMDILDLSAGGMRLRLTPQAIRHTMDRGVSFHKERKFFLRLHMCGTRHDPSAPLILFAQVKSVVRADKGLHVDMGLQFIGIASQGEGGELLWSRVPSEGVPLLIDWIFQCQLEQARRKTLALADC